MRLTEDIRHLYRSGRVGPPGPRTVLAMFRQPGLNAIAIYRLGHWLKNCRWPVRCILSPLYFYFSHRMKTKWGIEIQRCAVIGGGFIVSHYGCVFIGGRAVIGKNFIVHQGVTVGANPSANLWDMPTIGDNVVIAPGGVVLGNCRVGNDVKIGPNAVVMRHIPDNAVVAVATRVVGMPYPRGSDVDSDGAMRASESPATGSRT